MSYQPQQPQWQQPPYQHVVVHLPPYSALAVISLVTSLLWICGVGSIVGLVTGILGIKECDRTGKRGKGVAIAGTIIGAIGTAFLAIWIVLMIGLASSPSS